MSKDNGHFRQGGVTNVKVGYSQGLSRQEVVVYLIIDEMANVSVIGRLEGVKELALDLVMWKLIDPIVESNQNLCLSCCGAQQWRWPGTSSWVHQSWRSTDALSHHDGLVCVDGQLNAPPLCRC